MQHWPSDSQVHLNRLTLRIDEISIIHDCAQSIRDQAEMNMFIESSSMTVAPQISCPVEWDRVRCTLYTQVHSREKW